MTTEPVLYKQMKRALKEDVDLSDKQWKEFKSIFRIETFEKQAPIILPGYKKHELFFTCKGLLRVYTVAEDGKEATKGFKAENVFYGPLAAYRLSLPSMYGVEALEPSTLLMARFDDIYKLYEKQPVFDRLGRKLMEEIVIQKELRERIALHESAKDRYRTFQEKFPQFANRVPLYHIASFLGIAAESLSRIRGELANTGLS